MASLFDRAWKYLKFKGYLAGSGPSEFFDDDPVIDSISRALCDTIGA